MAVIGENQCKPVILYGRAPDGTMKCATTDGSGNLNLSGSTSAVDTIPNNTATPVIIFGLTGSQMQAVTTDGNGNLNV